MMLLEYYPLFLAGLVNTLKLSFAIVTGCTLFAILFATGMVLRIPLFSRLIYMIVEVLRDVPLMVTILLVYFVMPRMGLSLDPFSSSVLAISAWGGANGSHVIRAGLQAVPETQRETAIASGLRGWKGFLLVILPQAMPVILPPYIGLVTAWVQASSLGAVVGVNELFRSGQIVIEQWTILRGGSPAFVVYGMILVVYFVLCWLISRAGDIVERRFDKHRIAVVGLGKPSQTLHGSSPATVAAGART